MSLVDFLAPIDPFRVERKAGMKLEMLAMYDAKVEAFMTPFFAQSVGAAVRSVSDLVNGPVDAQGQPAPAAHPEDFSLFRLGCFWDSGLVELELSPVQVALCVNLKTERK